MDAHHITRTFFSRLSSGCYILKTRETVSREMIMLTRHFLVTIVVALSTFSSGVPAQQSLQATRSLHAADDSLVLTMRRAATPQQTTRVANIGTLSVRNGDQSTERVSDIVLRSFEEQDSFAASMNRTALVNSSAIAALPQVEDEVLVYQDAIVIRRSTTIIVIDPEQVARESTLYRDYLGDRSTQRSATARKPSRTGTLAVTSADDLDAEEKAGLQEFMRNGVNSLHPKDPLRAAAAQGEAAVIEAIAAGKGQLTIEDVLVIPTESGLDQGNQIAIPTVRDGVMDLRQPVPVADPAIRDLEANQPDPIPDPLPAPQMSIKANPVEPKESPPRQPLQPKAESSGKLDMSVEFLLGASRASNFQWERTWSYTSGFFRLTLGSGYAFGYRVPVIAKLRAEPTRAYLRDYSDKKVIIGAAVSARTVNGNANFYKNAGLANKLVKNGNELLLDANVGYGYKFRAFWKTIASRSYSSIGVSYSQNFTPPDNLNEIQSMQGGDTFGLTLDPKTTKISVNSTFIDGNATIKFDGRAWGGLDLEGQTLADGKVQDTFSVNTHMETMAGVYPQKLLLDPIPLRQGTTQQTREFGLRVLNLKYVARLVVLPKIKFRFRVGYKRLSVNFSTGWIPLNSLKVDTGHFSLKRHEGTRSSFTWNDGEKIYHHIVKPDSGPSYSN
jgi:hypothetical protein